MPAGTPNNLLHVLKPTRAMGALCAAALLVTVGCRSAVVPTQDAGVVAKRAERGPVAVEVRAEPSTVSVAEPLTFTIETSAAANVDVELPSVDGELGKLRLREVDVSPAIPTETGHRWIQTYTLECYSAGTHELPALTVRCTDRRDPDNAIENELTTPTLQIEVTSLIEGEFDPAEYRDIKSAVALPTPPSRAWLWWLLATSGGILAAILLALLLRRRARHVRVAPPIPPHEQALAALRGLRTDELIERGEIHEFYYLLTNIVRIYIEQRFGIMAAEQTTREFLEAAKDQPSLGGRYRDLLRSFLVAGDMVKFALHVPGQEECFAAFDAALGFVTETAPVSSTPGAAA